MRILTASTLLLSILALATLVQDTATRAAAPAPAADQPAKPAVAAKPALPRGPVLTGEDGQPIKGVRLAKADVRAVVQGTMAQTTMLLTFANDEGRILGGELVFPLPEGATVSGYGLDVNGVMVDGVAVEKQRARMIYEQEIHKRVDPGLVEHVVGNAFRTRLYPIPPNGTRQIKVQYVSEVEAGQGAAAGKAALTLPVGWSEVIDQVTLRVEVRDGAAAPVIAGPAGDQPTLKVSKADKGFIVEGTIPTKALGEGLSIVLPAFPKTSVSVERRPKMARTLEDLDAESKAPDAAKNPQRFEHFFAISDTPVPVEIMKKARPANIAVMWDASLSRADADHARELKLLESLLTRYVASAELVVFRNTAEPPVRFQTEGGGAAKLIEQLKGVTYDGATGLGALKFPKTPHELAGVRAVEERVPDFDYIVLFTDGLGNLGPDTPRAADVPVYAIANDDRVNDSALKALARQSGGGYINLKRVADDELALAAIRHGPFTIVSVDFKPEEVAEVYPGPGHAVQGRVTLAGRLLAPEAKVTVNYGYGKGVTQSETFTIKASDAVDGTLLPRFWAQQKVAELSLAPAKNAEAIEKVGKEFNLVTPSTSLLVLETADQYVQHRVVPPRERPEVYNEFLAKIEQHRAVEQKTKEEKIQQVLAMWDARTKWWEAEYKYPKDLKVAPENDKELALRAVVAEAGARRETTTGAAPPARPTAPPTPLPAPAPAPEPAPVVADPSPAAPRNPVTARPADARPNAPVAPGQQGQAPAGEVARNYDNRDLVLDVPDFSDAPDFNLARRSDGRPRDRGPGTGLFGGGERNKGKDGEADEDDLKRGEDRQKGARIDIKAWDPNTPYIQAMKAVPADKAYAVFLEQRKTFGRSPAFYLDCADYLVAAGQRALGVRVLTDVAELQLQDARLLRVAAHRLNQIGERDLAIDLFEKVLALRPEEPQSYRDLALALADRADASLSGGIRNGPDTGGTVSDYGRALHLLNKVITQNWDRFPEIEVTALTEANRIVATLSRLPMLGDIPNPLDPRLRKNLDMDVRIVMTWDADQTDIDLWVTEPSGEKCFYGHNRTIIGGLLSRDFTDGYGPEEYCLRRLMPGAYKIQANFYGSRQQELTGPATVQATVITNFGRPDEKRQALTLRLRTQTEVVDIGLITLGGDGKADVQPAPRAGPVGANLVFVLCPVGANLVFALC